MECACETLDTYRGTDFIIWICKKCNKATVYKPSTYNPYAKIGMDNIMGLYDRRDFGV